MSKRESLGTVLGECSYLLDVLAKVVKQHGVEPFLQNPLITASPEHFPREKGSECDRVAAIIARLAGFAGLSSVPMRLEDRRAGDDPASVHQAPIVPFIGFDGDVAVFSLQSLGAPDLLIATICHEVALCASERRGRRHPYRTAVTDAVPFTADDIVRAAVTTIYLGWGVITADGAHRFAKTGSIDGYMVRTEWSHGRVGALSAGEICCLLAVQAIVRDVDLHSAGFVTELQDNQRIELAAWIEDLRPHRKALCRRLEIRDDWIHFVAHGDRPDVEDEKAMVIVRRPVHRVRRHRTGEYGFIGGLIGAGLMISSLVLSSDADLFLLAFALPVLGAAIGVVVGKKRPKLFCSAWDCGALLEGDTKTCPGCGGSVQWEITIKELDELRARGIEKAEGLTEAAAIHQLDGGFDDDLDDDELDEAADDERTA